MLTKWFIRKRGLAFSVKFGVGGIVAVIALPFLSWLIESQGWRTASLVWAGMTFASLPLLLYFVKQKSPEYYGLFPDGAKPEPGAESMQAKSIEYAAGIKEIDFTFKQALRTSSLWILTIAWILNSIIVAGFNLHIIPFLTDRGIDPVAAGAMLAITMFISLPARSCGFFADRVKKEHLKFLLAGAPFLKAIGIVTFLLSPNTATVYVLLILWGVGFGAYVPLDIVIRGRYFGRKAYGSIQGISVLISAPFSFLSPVFTGWIYDVTGKYTTAFAVFAILAFVATLAICIVRVPKRHL